MQVTTAEHLYYADVRSGVDEDGRNVLIVPADEYYVRSKKQRDALRAKQEREFYRKYEQLPFTWAHMDAIKSIPSSVPTNYLSHLLYLQTFMRYEKGILQNDNNHSMTRSDLMRALGVRVSANDKSKGESDLSMSKRTFDDFMLCMRKHDIIRSGVVNGRHVYMVNSEYHFKGESDSDHVVKAFVDEVRKLYRNNSHADIGFVYKLLAYVHYSSNALVKEPYAKDIDKAGPLTLADIGEITGSKPSTLYQHMRQLKLGDEPVFERTDSDLYLINPRIFWRQKDKPDRTLLAIFEHKKNKDKRSKDKKNAAPHEAIRQ